MMSPMIALFLLALAGQETPAPRLLTEDLQGRTSEIPLAGLPITDPTANGVWIVRPRFFPSPERPPSTAPRARATLVNGDELVARVRGGEGEDVHLELAGGVLVRFDVSSLASLVFADQIPPDQRLALAPADEGDRLYRLSGALDALDGTLEGFTDEGVRFDGVLGLRTYPWAEVGALYIEALGSAPGRGGRGGRGVPVAVDFAGADGGRVRGDLIALERDALHIVLGGDTEVALPYHAIDEIVVDDGRLQYVSSLVPRQELGRGAPFGDELGLAWPHRMDRSVAGTPLTSGGSPYRRGIGMHAPSRLVFALDGEPRTLRGRLAIDDSTAINAEGARGSVVFRVHADGERLWESPLVRGGDAPIAFPPLDLAGKHELVLEVDPAGDFAGDRANWLDLVLVR
jgi:hypothetical protein